MKRKELYEAMRKAMENLVQDLRGKPCGELSALPKYVGQECTFGKWKYTLSTYRETIEDGTVQIMVQAYHHFFLGIGTIMADGFRKAKDESFSEVPQNIRYQYI